eukprot:132387_1
MCCKDGHIVKFQKEIKNNNHLLTFQKIKLESKTTTTNCNVNQHDKKVNQIPQIITNNSSLNNNNNNNISHTPTFKIDPTTITHEQFWYNLSEMILHETYY